MIFNTLADKCNFYRNLTDYRLLPNGYVLVMIDGKNFSTLIKNKFEKPFDSFFIDIMNKTAEYLCKKIQGVKGAYVQSDEISFLIKDAPDTCLPFDGRLCKLQSIIPALATSFFTKEMVKYFIEKNNDEFDILNTCDIGYIIDNMSDYVFDCKAWTVPSHSHNDAMSWFLYRQIDCVRNSKQQFCQTYLPHKELMNKNTDKQVKLCIEKTGLDWNLISDDKKYGRFLYKKLVTKINDKGEEYLRHVWDIISFDLTDLENRETLVNKWITEE